MSIIPEFEGLRPIRRSGKGRVFQSKAFSMYTYILQNMGIYIFLDISIGNDIGVSGNFFIYESALPIHVKCGSIHEGHLSLSLMNSQSGCNNLFPVKCVLTLVGWVG